MSLIYGTLELASGEGSEIVPQSPFQIQPSG